MTRERIYKAKTTPKEDGREFNNIWVYGDLIKSGKKYYIHSRSNLVRVSGELGKLIVMHEVIPETICAGTELPDATGKEIFEGDIIEIKGNYSADVIGNWEVYFSDICHNWSLRRSEEYHTCYLSFSDLNGFNEDSAVIGNAYDNPELLKEGE